jgi:hypothetical protein
MAPAVPHALMGPKTRTACSPSKSSERRAQSRLRRKRLMTLVQTKNVLPTSPPPSAPPRTKAKPATISATRP